MPKPSGAEMFEKIGLAYAFVLILSAMICLVPLLAIATIIKWIL